MIKLAIIVGHEKTRSGAMGVSPLSMSEYEYNSQVAKEVYKAAREEGITACVFLKDNMTPESVGKYIESWINGEESYTVELHFNACNGKASGTEVLYESSISKEFAIILQRNICSVFERTGKANRGAKQLSEGDRGHRNLSHLAGTACLLEPGFGDNPFDAKLLAGRIFQYSNAIVQSVLEYHRISNE